MKIRLIRRTYRSAITGGIHSHYILQVKPNTPHNMDSDEDWQTVPIIPWDDLYDDEKKAIEKELS